MAQSSKPKPGACFARWAWLPLLAVVLLLGAGWPGKSQAASLSCAAVPRNTAFYLRFCCPRPCPVIDRTREEANQRKLELMSTWARQAGLESVHLQLLLQGVGQRTVMLPFVETPLHSYRVLENERMQGCLTSPRELVANRLIAPLPEETATQFANRAWEFAVRNMTPNVASNYYDTVPARVARRHCQNRNQENFAMVQLSVAMSAQSTARGIQRKFYDYIRAINLSDMATCAPQGAGAPAGSLNGFLSDAQGQLGNILGGLFGDGGAFMSLASGGLLGGTPGQGGTANQQVAGCLRQDIFLNTQIRADVALIKMYVDALRGMDTMGRGFVGLVKEELESSY